MRAANVPVVTSPMSSPAADSCGFTAATAPGLRAAPSRPLCWYSPSPRRISAMPPPRPLDDFLGRAPRDEAGGELFIGGGILAVDQARRRQRDGCIFDGQ